MKEWSFLSELPTGEPLRRTRWEVVVRGERFFDRIVGDVVRDTICAGHGALWWCIRRAHSPFLYPGLLLLGYLGLVAGWSTGCKKADRRMVWSVRSSLPSWSSLLLSVSTRSWTDNSNQPPLLSPVTVAAAACEPASGLAYSLQPSFSSKWFLIPSGSRLDSFEPIRHTA